MSKMMKFNRIAAIIFGFLFGFGGLVFTILGLSQGRPVDMSMLIVILIAIGAFFWGIKELRKKEMTPLGKENEQ